MVVGKAVLRKARYGDFDYACYIVFEMSRFKMTFGRCRVNRTTK